jgi:predicted RNA-binding protein YlxR (DUF448 family)
MLFVIMARRTTNIERICCVCRIKQSTAVLIRAARVKNENNPKENPYKFAVDRAHKLGGRGCYICPKCIEKSIKSRALNRSFKSPVPDSIYRELSEQIVGENNDRQVSG